MNGYGVYRWKDGSVYKGEWTDGEMHGCGSWRKKGQSNVDEGQFLLGRYIGPGLACPVDAARYASNEADEAASRASGFTLKPQ